MIIQSNIKFVDDTTTPIVSKTFSNSTGDVLAIQIKGSGTMYLEGRMQRDAEWVSLAGINLSDFSMTKDGFTKSGIYEVGIIGIREIRARVTSVSGNLSVFGQIISSEET